MTEDLICCKPRWFIRVLHVLTKCALPGSFCSCGDPVIPCTTDRVRLQQRAFLAGTADSGDAALISETPSVDTRDDSEQG